MKFEYFKTMSIEDIKYVDKNGGTRIEQWFPCVFLDNGVVWDYANYYHVSDLGRVKSLKRGGLKKDGSLVVKQEKISKQSMSADGYLRLSLTAKEINNGRPKKMLVHRLVLLCAGVPNPKMKKQVNHINGVKTDNRITELEWNTHEENQRHAWGNGYKKPKLGEDVPFSKLTEKQIIEISTSHKKTSQLSIEYNVSYWAIWSIRKGKNWGWLTGLKHNKEKILK